MVNNFTNNENGKKCETEECPVKLQIPGNWETLKTELLSFLFSNPIYRAMESIPHTNICPKRFIITYILIISTEME